MTSKKSAKRELLSSVMALLICIAMFSGTTYAWFTDSVTSGINRIVAGNLDVELYHSNETVTDEEVDASTLLFTDIDLWEPGAMVYENFTVENAGSLALKYVFNLKVTNATVVNGRSLADVLKVAVVDGGVADDRPTALSEDFSPINSFSLNGSLESDGTDTFGIIVYWQPGENDNDYNVAGEVFEISIGVDLFATQMISESDSFDNTYDAGAQLPITLIAPITVSGNTLAAPVTLGASSASAVSAENPVHVSVPSGAKVEENTTDFIVTVQQTNAEVPVNPASTAVAFDINMPLASDNTAIVPITMHIGAGLNLVAVYHDGVEMTEADTEEADTYQYDPVSGIITLYITHCSEFAFVYGADFAVSNFEEFLAALDDAEDGDVIGLTANINPAYDFEFTKSVVVVIDMRSFGFTRAREADGGYKIAIDPDCNLTMMNGGWDIDAAFGDISTKGSNGTCVVNFKNVVFTDLKPGNPGSPLTNAFHGNMWGNMTVNVTFENCTFNNVGIEFSGSHSEVESDNTYIAEFIGCTFNSTVGNFLYVIDADNYCMTDDCEVTVTNCTFNIISTGNALIFDNIFSSPTVKLNFTNNTVNGFRYDPNDLSAYVKVCLPGTNFDVTASGNIFTGIASFN